MCYNFWFILTLINAAEMRHNVQFSLLLIRPVFNQSISGITKYYCELMTASLTKK